MQNGKFEPGDDIGPLIEEYIADKGERTIRNYAKAKAGAFYDAKRSPRFRNGDELCWAYRVVMRETGPVQEKVEIPFKIAYPTKRDYVRAWWPFYYSGARAQLTAMLGMPDVAANIKEAIYKAIVEDRENQLKNGGKMLRQREVTRFGDENDPLRTGDGR